MKRYLKMFLTLLFVTVTTTSQLRAVDHEFDVSLVILQAHSATEVTPLTIQDIEVKEIPQTITISPADSGAAAFALEGDESSTMKASIIESEISLTLGATTISVDNFTFSGSLSSDEQKDSAKQGKVGLTANVPANPTPGVYSGNVTLRLIYG